MSVIGAHSICLEVPDLEIARKFYTDAGLVARELPDRLEFTCASQSEPSIITLQGQGTKRLHHIALQADLADRGGLQKNIENAGGQVQGAPQGFPDGDIWVVDPHGMSIRLTERRVVDAQSVTAAFSINQPGFLNRKSRGAVPPRATQADVLPIKLGHILVFSPDVPRSVAFLTEGLGMGLADKSQDVIAFCCARKNSEHHVVAFAKSPGVGFHHASFLVNDPDEVGRGGVALRSKTSGGDWGFGRHTIGSNFFHYIQDPWGSWFEYYSDMDHIEDHSRWTPTDYALEDSLASWGPDVPDDFVHNYECDEHGYRKALAVDA